MKRTAIWRWLRQDQATHYIGRILLFGSIVGREMNFADVDALIIIRPLIARTKVRSLKNRFKHKFGLRLDVQLFQKSQIREIIHFKIIYGPFKEV